MGEAVSPEQQIITALQSGPQHVSAISKQTNLPLHLVQLQLAGMVDRVQVTRGFAHLITWEKRQESERTKRAQERERQRQEKEERLRKAVKATFSSVFRGLPATVGDVASLIRQPVDKVAPIVAELEESGYLARDGSRYVLSSQRQARITNPNAPECGYAPLQEIVDRVRRGMEQYQSSNDWQLSRFTGITRQQVREALQEIARQDAAALAGQEVNDG